MLRKLLTLAVVPVVLLCFAQLGAMRLVEHSLKQVINYRSPYAVPLEPGTAGKPLVQQVVLVVVDGLRDDMARQMPALNALRARGAGRTLRTGQPSLSHPTWTTIGTGSWQEQNGVTTNWYEGKARVDSLLARAHAAGLTTALSGPSAWAELYAGQWDGSAITDWQGPGTDDRILAGALRLLREQNPDLLLVHFEAPDEAGHASGAASAAYRDEAMAVDRLIGRLAKAVDLENAVFAVTADHGQIDPGGHGGWEPVVLNVPLVIAGRGIIPGEYPAGQQADVAPTLAVLLGTAYPAHSQGQPLWELLALDDAARAERAVALAAQQVALYAARARAIGAGSPDDRLLAQARAALAAGDYDLAYRAASDLAAGLPHQAEAGRSARLWRERAGRLPIALLVLAPFGLWLYAARRGGWDLRVPLLSACVYFALYYGLFFARGNSFSLSAFNSESQMTAYFGARVLDALLALVAGGLLAGFLSAGRDWYGAALAAVNTLFLVALALAVQVVVFYWLWDVNFSWYLPDLAWGFKFFLDVLQAAAFYPKLYLPAAALVPLLALGGRWAAQSLSCKAPRRTGVESEVA